MQRTHPAFIAAGYLALDDDVTATSRLRRWAVTGLPVDGDRARAPLVVAAALPREEGPRFTTVAAHISIQAHQIQTQYRTGGTTSAIRVRPGAARLALRPRV